MILYESGGLTREVSPKALFDGEKQIPGPRHGGKGSGVVPSAIKDDRKVVDRNYCPYESWIRVKDPLFIQATICATSTKNVSAQMTIERAFAALVWQTRRNLTSVAA